jgi:hypothetical protein
MAVKGNQSSPATMDAKLAVISDFKKSLLEVITSPHPLNATLSIHNALLAGVERMAITTNFYSEGRFSAASFENIAARASYDGFYELRVNFCFHDVLLFGAFCLGYQYKLDA